MTQAMCAELPEAIRPKPLRSAYTHAGFRYLLHEAAAVFGVTIGDIMGRDRHKTIANARHVVGWVARAVWGHSYPELAILLDRKDHTTMLSAVRKIDADVRHRTRVGEIALRLKAAREAQLHACSDIGASIGPRSSSTSNEERLQP